MWELLVGARTESPQATGSDAPAGSCHSTWRRVSGQHAYPLAPEHAHTGIHTAFLSTKLCKQFSLPPLHLSCPQGLRLHEDRLLQLSVTSQIPPVSVRASPSSTDSVLTATRLAWGCPPSPSTPSVHNTTGQPAWPPPFLGISGALSRCGWAPAGVSDWSLAASTPPAAPCIPELTGDC